MPSLILFLLIHPQILLAKWQVNKFTLPKASPFFKHVALRFQLPPNHCSGTSHRIILLPWVQSTRRTLMQNSMPVKVPSTLCRFHFCTLSTSCTPSSCIHSLVSLLLPPPGHLFSAWHGITIGSPGEIARGRVRVRLSRMRFLLLVLPHGSHCRCRRAGTV